MEQFVPFAGKNNLVYVLCCFLLFFFLSFMAHADLYHPWKKTHLTANCQA